MTDWKIPEDGSKFDSHIFKHKHDFSDCWMWEGGKFTSGYGCYYMNGKAYRAHRLAWMRVNGKEVPEGMCICHRCENPACVNPDHLFIATKLENIVDRDNKGRQSRGELHPSHIFTEDDIRAMRLLRVSGFSQKYIVDLFKSSHSTIGSILQGRKWKHVK